MDAHVLLADFAQTDQSGKVNALGLGWSVTQTPTPHHAVVVMFRVGWGETNEKHKLVLSLLTEDGHEAVSAPTPFGPQPLQMEAEFEVGRPPGLPQGVTIDHALAINIGPGLPLAPGRYEWRLSIGGKDQENWRAPFTVQAPLPG